MFSYIHPIPVKHHLEITNYSIYPAVYRDMWAAHLSHHQKIACPYLFTVCCNASSSATGLHYTCFPLSLLSANLIDVLFTQLA